MRQYEDLIRSPRYKRAGQIARISRLAERLLDLNDGSGADVADLETFLEGVSDIEAACLYLRRLVGGEP